MKNWKEYLGNKDAKGRTAYTFVEDGEIYSSLHPNDSKENIIKLRVKKVYKNELIECYGIFYDQNAAPCKMCAMNNSCYSDYILNIKKTGVWIKSNDELKPFNYSGKGINRCRNYVPNEEIAFQYLLEEEK